MTDRHGLDLTRIGPTKKETILAGIGRSIPCDQMPDFVVYVDWRGRHRFWVLSPDERERIASDEGEGHDGVL